MSRINREHDRKGRAPRLLLLAPVALSLLTPPTFAPSARADAPAARAAVDGAPAPDAPLSPAPGLHQTTLPNGMRVWVRPHKMPPGKVTIWMRVGTGSLDEEDDERGLAHFVEHMAFNGTKHFPPGKLVKYFESIGAQFGADQNAFTSFDQTTYQLSLPDVRPATVDKGLLWMADVAARMTFDRREIDEERAVILAELRARKGPDQRLLEKQLPLMFPGSRLAARLPKGDEAVIAAVDRARFVAFARARYRPERTTLLVVGDVEPQAIASRIAAAFRDFRAVGPAAAARTSGVKALAGSRVFVDADPDLPVASVSISSARPLEPVRTVKDHRARLVDRLAATILDRRLAALVEAGAPFRAATTAIQPLVADVALAQVEARGAPERWSDTLKVLATELKRLRAGGFSAGEIEEARKALLARAEEKARREPTLDARVVAAGLHAALAEGRVPLGAEQELGLARALLPAVTAAEIAAAVERAFPPQARFTSVLLPGKAGKAGNGPGAEAQTPLPTTAAVEAALAAAEAAPLVARAGAARIERLLEREPAPGAIVEQAEDRALGVTSATLSNGVRLHARTMTDKKDAVEVQITLAGGALRETAETRGLAQLAGAAAAQPGTRRYTSTQLRDHLSATSVKVGGGAAPDALTFTVRGMPHEIEEGLRVAHLWLLEAKLEPSASARWRERVREAEHRRNGSVEAQVTEAIGPLLAGRDPRTAPVTTAQTRRLTDAAAQAWLDGQLRGAPIEVAIVGDLPKARALALGLKYFGSLPARAPVARAHAEARKIAAPRGPFVERLEVETVTPRAVVALGYRGPELGNVPDRRALLVAANVLQSRLIADLREKRRLTYGAQAALRESTFLVGGGALMAALTVDPAKAEEAARLARGIVEALAASGPTPAELDAAKRQLRNHTENRQREPDYWAAVLARLAFEGRTLDESRDKIATIEALTPEEIRKVLGRYVGEAGRFEIVARPRGAVATP